MKIEHKTTARHFKTLQEIKKAVNNGITVFWCNYQNIVQKTILGKKNVAWRITGAAKNRNWVSLTQNGQLDIDPQEFYFMIGQQPQQVIRHSK